MSRITLYKKIKIFILLSFFSTANAQYVYTFAGSTQGFADGTDSAAQFFGPSGIAVDIAGNIYVADDDNHSIRKITTSGVVSTLAGNGTPGFADGTGTSAQFNSPLGVALDVAGNIYVADGDNNRIRKITPAGVVSTFAGSGIYGFADGPGATARFSDVYGLTVDADGNVFVADTFNHRIRKITASGVVTTLAGSTQGFADGSGTVAKFNNPIGVAVDPTGTVFITDSGNSLIRKITASGVVTTLAGSIHGFADGPATEAQFFNPCGLYINSAGTIFVGDSRNNRIREITPDGIVSTFAGSIPGTNDGAVSMAQFYMPWGLAVDGAGTMFVTDRGNNRIRKITGTLSTAHHHQDQVSIYPNPASATINIEFDNTAAAIVTICDMNGRALQSKYVIDKKSSISINNLANGIYLIEINMEGVKISKKIVKQ